MKIANVNGPRQRHRRRRHRSRHWERPAARARRHGTGEDASGLRSAIVVASPSEMSVDCAVVLVSLSGAYEGSDAVLATGDSLLDGMRAESTIIGITTTSLEM